MENHTEQLSVRHDFVLLPNENANKEGWVRLPGDDLYKDEKCTHCGVVKRTLKVRGKSIPKYLFMLPGTSAFVSAWQVCEKRRYHATLNTQDYRQHGKPVIVAKGAPASIHEVQALVEKTKNLAVEIKEMNAQLDAVPIVEQEQLGVVPLSEPPIAPEPITEVTPEQVQKMKCAFADVPSVLVVESPASDTLLPEALMLLSWIIKDLNFTGEGATVSYPLQLAKAFIQRPQCAALMTQSLKGLNANPTVSALLLNLFGTPSAEKDAV